MKSKVQLTIMFIIITFFAGTARAQDLYVFPSKGQSPEQMEKDKYECYIWAKGQTGFDPMETPTATSPPPEKTAPTTSPLRGAARGAAVGAVVGEIKDDDPGRGAAVGAATGALVGGMRRRDQMRRQAQEEQQWEEQQAAQYTQRRNEYNRAYTVCLEGKGYNVK